MLAIPFPDEGVVHVGGGRDLGEGTQGDAVNRPQNICRHVKSLKGLVDVILEDLVAGTRADCEEEGEAFVAIHLCLLGYPYCCSNLIQFFSASFHIKRWRAIVIKSIRITKFITDWTLVSGIRHSQPGRNGILLK